MNAWMMPPSCNSRGRPEGQGLLRYRPRDKSTTTHHFHGSHRDCLDQALLHTTVWQISQVKYSSLLRHSRVAHQGAASRVYRRLTMRKSEAESKGYNRVEPRASLTTKVSERTENSRMMHPRIAIGERIVFTRPPTCIRAWQCNGRRHTRLLINIAIERSSHLVACRSDEDVRDVASVHGQTRGISRIMIGHATELTDTDKAGLATNQLRVHR